MAVPKGNTTGVQGGGGAGDLKLAKPPRSCRVFEVDDGLFEIHLDLTRVVLSPYALIAVAVAVVCWLLERFFFAGNLWVLLGAPSVALALYGLYVWIKTSSYLLFDAYDGDGRIYLKTLFVSDAYEGLHVDVPPLFTGGGIIGINIGLAVENFLAQRKDDGLLTRLKGLTVGSLAFKPQGQAEPVLVFGPVNSPYALVSWLKGCNGAIQKAKTKGKEQGEKQRMADALAKANAPLIAAVKEQTEALRDLASVSPSHRVSRRPHRPIQRG